jgi:hypothetical protein
MRANFRSDLRAIPHRLEDAIEEHSIMRAPRLPRWWGWPLEFPDHVRERMRQRNFSETDVRHMLFRVRRVRPLEDPFRWSVDSELDRTPWRIILEPDPAERVVVVVTAYPLAPPP